jgi:hypothetical protein
MIGKKRLAFWQQSRILPTTHKQGNSLPIALAFSPLCSPVGSSILFINEKLKEFF